MAKSILKKKRAIELSVNFIVMLILAIVTFSLALGITYSIFKKAYSVKTDIDSQTEAQIGSLLDSGEQVALPVSRLTIPPGKNDIFGLGVLNTEDTEETFKVIIEPDKVKAYDQNGDENANAENSAKSNGGIEITYIENDVKINANSRQVYKITAKVGDKVLSDFVYTYTIRVVKSSGITEEDYGLPKRISIEVT